MNSIHTNIVVYKSLGDLCEIIIGKRVNVYSKRGKYKVYDKYGPTKFNTNTTCNTTSNLNCLLTVSQKNPVILLTNQFYLCESGMMIKSKNENILNDYLMFYIYMIKHKISDCISKNYLNIDLFNNILIPIPDIKTQNELIDIFKKLIILNIHF